MSFHKRAKQNWDIGATVKVGFLDGLKVLEKIATPGNYLPDQYVLERKGIYYSYTPYNGISRCLTIEQARQW